MRFGLSLGGLWAHFGNLLVFLEAVVAHIGAHYCFCAILCESGCPQGGGMGGDPLAIGEYCILASWMVVLAREYSHWSKVVVGAPAKVSHLSDLLVPSRYL